MHLVDRFDESAVCTLVERGQFLVLREDTPSGVQQPLGLFDPPVQVPRLDVPLLLNVIYARLVAPRLQDEHTLHPPLLVQVDGLG